MKISYNWLKTLINLDISVEETLAPLTEATYVYLSSKKAVSTLFKKSEINSVSF